MSASTKKAISTGLSGFARVVSQFTGRRSPRRDVRAGSSHDKDHGTLYNIFGEEVSAKDVEEPTYEIDCCWKQQGFDSHKQIAGLIFTSVSECPRSFLLQGIVCERRSFTNPPTMERLSERLRYRRFSPSKHAFVMFSRHGLRGWEHTHAIHDCSWRKSWCPCGIMRN